jgi:hypothetical protein
LPAEVKGDRDTVLRATAVSPSLVSLSMHDVKDVSGASAAPVATEVPRYWLARMLHRVALHGLRLGYVETYGGFFVDDRADSRDSVELGIRTPGAKHAVSVPRTEALTVLERLYRAVAPPGYRERMR